MSVVMERGQMLVGSKLGSEFVWLMVSSVRVKSNWVSLFESVVTGLNQHNQFIRPDSMPDWPRATAKAPTMARRSLLNESRRRTATQLQ
jgi:hypothetical protein